MKLGTMERFVLDAIGTETVTISRVVTIQHKCYLKRRGAKYSYPGESLARLGFYKRAMRMVAKGLLEPTGAVNENGKDLYRCSSVPLAEILKREAPPTPPKKKPSLLSSWGVERP